MDDRSRGNRGIGAKALAGVLPVATIRDGEGHPGLRHPRVEQSRSDVAETLGSCVFVQVYG